VRRFGCGFDGTTVAAALLVQTPPSAQGSGEFPMGRRSRLAVPFLIALSIAGSASAGDERRLQLIVAGGNAFDLTTTLVLANQSSIVETNPFMQRAAVPLKASATAAEM